ncbi:MAG: (2Fe-2S) ferredoxin domain-containing protein [Chloroflexi bacterium]|nr:(2Fe-2S) ferredoxin domain-containing protein [Chloroflexota bacterium]
MSENTGPARRRIVLCMGPFCNQGGRAERFYARLREVLGDPMPAFMARGPVTWETANCLSMCGAGPNLIVYPEDIVYNFLDDETLEQVITEYVLPPDDAT